MSCDHFDSSGKRVFRGDVADEGAERLSGDRRPGEGQVVLSDVRSQDVHYIGAIDRECARNHEANA